MRHQPRRNSFDSHTGHADGVHACAAPTADPVEQALEPGIACSNAAIVSIMAEVGGDPGKIWQPIGRQIIVPVGERDDAGAVRWIVANGIKIEKGVVLGNIGQAKATRAGRRHILDIGFPGFMGGFQLIYQIGRIYAT